jgi:hypothetical protein
MAKKSVPLQDLKQTQSILEVLLGQQNPLHLYILLHSSFARGRQNVQQSFQSFLAHRQEPQIVREDLESFKGVSNSYGTKRREKITYVMPLLTHEKNEEFFICFGESSISVHLKLFSPNFNIFAYIIKFSLLRIVFLPVTVCASFLVMRIFGEGAN